MLGLFEHLKLHDLHFHEKNWSDVNEELFVE